MQSCCVPNCPSNGNDTAENVQFFKIPNEKNRNGKIMKRVTMKSQRRQAWIKAIGLSDDKLKSARVCSIHFVTGQPTSDKLKHHVDWVPSINLRGNVSKHGISVENIIQNLPDIPMKFDRPQYVLVGESKLNQKLIETHIIKKYISSPVCNEDGLYDNDHDYLGLPLLPPVIDKRLICDIEHNYSLDQQPACLSIDLRHFCNICERNCNNMFSFNRHIDEHTLSNDVMCQICKQRFLTSTCLQNHLNSHYSLCEMCGNEVPSVQIKAHKLINRNQKLKKNNVYRYEVNPAKKVYFCITCMEEFENEIVFINHQNSHNTVRS